MFARDRLGARRVAILYEVGRSYSAQLARSFRRGFDEPAAGRVVAEFYYLALETDFRPQLRRIREFKPDVVFMPGSFPDATLAAVQARQVGLHATMLGGDAWSSPLLFQKGAPPGDAYYVELCSPAPEFDREYAAAIGSEPPGCRAVLAYDTVRVIAAGLRQLGALSAEDLGARLPPDAPAPARRRRARPGGRRHRPHPLRRARQPPAGCRALRGRADPARPARPGARVAGGAVSGVLGALRDMSLRRKVTLTLAVVFVASVVALLVALVPVLGEQRQRLLDQDKRLLSTLRSSYEREFIYDQLFRNRESLALHLAALAGQEGILWARLQAGGLDLGATADTGTIRRLIGDDALPYLGQPGVALLVDQDGEADLVGPGGRQLLAGRQVRREEIRAASPLPPGQDDFREAMFAGQRVLALTSTLSAAGELVRPAAGPEEPRTARARGAHHAAAVLRRRDASHSCWCCCC